MSCISQFIKIIEKNNIQPVVFYVRSDEPYICVEGAGIYKNYEYLITFTTGGFRCGYVALKDNKEVEDEDIECHGGITFNSSEHPLKQFLDHHCDDTWIGFDCMHITDLKCQETLTKYFGKNDYDDNAKNLSIFNSLLNSIYEKSFFMQNPSHKSFEYVENECKSIIDQLVSKND